MIMKITKTKKERSDPIMSDHCLICFQEITPRIGWNDLISATKKQIICPTCQSKLQVIEGPTCRICGRPLERLDARFIHGDTCYDCVRWEEDPNWRGCLTKNQSLFLYNDFLQEVIARYKFRGDYILASIFAEWIIQKLATGTPNILVPIPLSEERLLERGFNQAKALIREAGLQPAEILTRIHTEKQSKKSRNDRIHVQQVFQLEEVSLAGKNIMLIDDIYTTGSTLRHAAKILKEGGASSVSSITIARG